MTKPFLNVSKVIKRKKRKKIVKKDYKQLKKFIKEVTKDA